MTALVLTAVGDDRPGLVDALSTTVAAHGGNWERAQMTRLAGKFAGIVLVSVPDGGLDDLRGALAALAADGLDVELVLADDAVPAPAPATASVSVEGTDRPGVVREVTHVLAERGVSIESLDTQVRDAPMAGGRVFSATATLVVPDGVDLGSLRAAVEAAVPDFLVEVDTLDP